MNSTHKVTILQAHNISLHTNASVRSYIAISLANNEVLLVESLVFTVSSTALMVDTKFWKCYKQYK